MTDTTTAPKNPPLTETGQSQPAPENPKKGLEEYLNRFLLFISFLVWFFFALLALSIKIDVLSGSIVFFVAFFLDLFPGAKKIHQQAWFRSLWVTVVLFLFILVGSIPLAFQVEKRLAAAEPFPTATVQPTAVAQAQATPILAPTATPTLTLESTATPAPTQIAGMPFEIAEHYDFENNVDQNDISPWKSWPDEVHYPLSVSEKYSCSGKSSIELTVELDGGYMSGISAHQNDVGSFTKDRMIAATGYVFIPKTTASKDIVFSAKIQAFTKDTKNQYLATIGQVKNFTPGECMQITWAGPDSIEILDASDSSKKIATFYSNEQSIFQFNIFVWATKPYKGEIYFDDITFYTEPE